MDQLKDLLKREPVLVINAVVAIAALLAGYGLDVDPEGIGAALGALLVLAGVTRANVYSPATAEAEAQAAAEAAASDESGWEERGIRIGAEGYSS